MIGVDFWFLRGNGTGDGSYLYGTTKGDGYGRGDGFAASYGSRNGDGYGDGILEYGDGYGDGCDSNSAYGDGFGGCSDGNGNGYGSEAE